MPQVSLTDKQAKLFALSVYKDIRAYCEEHKREFDLFLAEYNAEAEEGGRDESGDI